MLPQLVLPQLMVPQLIPTPVMCGQQRVLACSLLRLLHGNKNTAPSTSTLRLRRSRTF
jgi:hypothetical protein